MTETYPFLREIIDTVLGETLDAPPSLMPEKSVYHIRYSFRRVDAEAWLRQPAALADSVECSFLYKRRGERKIWRAWHKEWLFAASDREILNSAFWPPEDGRRYRERSCLRQVLWQRTKGAVDPIHEKTRYLAWVTLRIFLLRTRKKDEMIGESLERYVDVQLYPEPDTGFRASENNFLAKNFPLSTKS